MRQLSLKIFLLACTSLLWAAQCPAATVNVAVAANFTHPMQKIARAFTAKTGYQTRLAFGSSGNLYAQILHGAPFQVFLSADEEKPEKLEKAGLGIPGSRFTYAVGALVLWSATTGLVDAGGKILQRGDFQRLSLANPRLAPYGRAAVQTLRAMHLYKKLQAKFVEGENISQTYQFVMSGNAEVGFVAKSQVFKNDRLKSGSGWVVPSDLYTPIRQDALLLKSAHNDPAAQALLSFMRGPEAGAIIHAYGYRR